MTVFGPHQALGTIWYVECFSDIDEDQLATFVTDYLETFESRYSRFRSDSWLSVLNQTGEFKSPDPEFVALLRQGQSSYEATNGIFNIAVGERMNASGYDSQYSFTASDVIPAVPALETTLKVQDEKITLTNGQLDLGGYAKGFCIDRLAEKLESDLDCTHFLVNGGGDMYVSSDNDKAVEIALAHPTQPGESIGTVLLKDQGFAASSPHVRAWTDAKTNETQNHLLSEAAVASYVVAEDAATADVWATAASIDREIQTPQSIEMLLVDEEQIIKTTETFLLNT